MKDKVYIPFTPEHPGWHDFTIQAAPYIHHYQDLHKISESDLDSAYLNLFEKDMDETYKAIVWFASVFFNVPEKYILSLDIQACINNYLDEYNSTRERSQKRK